MGLYVCVCRYGLASPFLGPNFIFPGLRPEGMKSIHFTVLKPAKYSATWCSGFWHSGDASGHQETKEANGSDKIRPVRRVDGADEAVSHDSFSLTASQKTLLILNWNEVDTESYIGFSDVQHDDSIITCIARCLPRQCGHPSTIPRYYSTAAHIPYAVLQQPLRSTTPSTFLKSTLTKTNFHILGKNTIKPTRGTLTVVAKPCVLPFCFLTWLTGTFDPRGKEGML